VADNNPANMFRAELTIRDHSVQDEQHVPLSLLLTLEQAALTTLYKYDCYPKTSLGLAEKEHN